MSWGSLLASDERGGAGGPGCVCRAVVVCRDKDFPCKYSGIGGLYDIMKLRWFSWVPSTLSHTE